MIFIKMHYLIHNDVICLYVNVFYISAPTLTADVLVKLAVAKMNEKMT